MPTDNAELKKFMNNAAKPQGAQPFDAWIKPITSLIWAVAAV